MCSRKAHAVHLTVDLVRGLLRVQFPQWADLAIRPVDHDGWDNTTFRLGDDMSVRLPSHVAYAAQVDKEHRWLPKIAPHLPLPIPTPLSKGEPTDDFPMPWSVYGWIEGDIAAVSEHALDAPAVPIADMTSFAVDLADFLHALWRVGIGGSPEHGWHNFFRGGPLSVWSAPSPMGEAAETTAAIARLNGEIDAAAVTEVWETALASAWDRAPVWVHGDVAPTNLLVRNGRLGAVIDFGCSAVGDPACDLVSAWTFFTGDSRDAFREALGLDADTWARGRGWALWKALLVLRQTIDGDQERAAAARRVIDEIVTDYAR